MVKKQNPNAISLTDDQKALIEKVGVMIEAGGLQPAPSRILALLMVSPDSDLSFDQIRDTLNLSKSATSNGINLLLTLKKIDYVTRSGERKRYFRNRISFWKEDIMDSFEALSESADILEEVLTQRPGNTTKLNNDLKNVIDFIRFLSRELPGMIKDWEAQKS